MTEEIAEKHDVTVIPVNCEQLKKDDINNIMMKAVSVFPITEVDFYLPKWAEMLSDDHWLKINIIEAVKEVLIRLLKLKMLLQRISQQIVNI